LIDGQVGPEQLREHRIRDADVQDLLQRVEVYPDDALTRGYPRTTPVRVGVTTKGGRELIREQTDFEGAPTRPLSWDRVVEKFHWLSEPYADAELRDQIVAAVDDIESRPITELTTLLGRVSPTAASDRTRRPI
jgi:2-methylcitrate dehydratase